MVVWAAFWTVPSVVPFFSTLEAGVRSVSRSGGISLGVVLVSITLIAVVVPLSAIVIAAIVVLTMIVSLSAGWCFVPVDIHGDWDIIHPLWGI